MSANIESMMYYGDTPWHGLGTKIEKAATSEEAINAAGLNWTVKKEPVQYGKDGRTAEGWNVVVRQDDGRALGVVGDVYEPLQNKEAFSFFDAVVGEKAAMYHTAGSLGEGECVWILAKLPGYVRVVGDDITEKFLLLTNRHDGQGAVKVLFTPIRVVCQNTLNIAITEAREQGSKVSKVRHTASMGMRVNDVQADLGIISARYAMFEEAAKRLAMTQVTQSAFETYIKKVGLVQDAGEKLSSRAQNIMDELSSLFEGRQKGGDMQGVKGTAWGAFNAVAEYADYHRGTRNTGLGAANSRATSLLFGQGQVIKQKAWDAAVELV